MSQRKQNFGLGYLKVLTLVMTTCLMPACTPEKFTGTTAASDITNSVLPSPTPDACVPVADITRLTKVLFVVDTSGSNSEWVNSTGDKVCSSHGNVGCIPPTDPQKTFRLGSIRKFVTEYGGMKNLEWGFITFSNEHAIDYIGVNGAPSFTSSLNVIQSALDQFAVEKDYADTPYGAALTAATAAIEADKDHNTAANPQYYVVMLTDGFPTDLKTAAALTTRIQAMLKAAPTEVTVSTIFYGTQNMPASLAAEGLLKVIAKAGNGQFANVNNTATGIDIDAVIPGHACPAN